MLLTNWRPWRRLGNKSKDVKAVGDPQVLALAKELEAWQKRRIFISVSLPHDGRTYQSMILAVNAPQRLFLLDSLFPKEFNSQFLLHQILGLEARLPHTRQYLSARCVNFGSDAGESANDRPLVMEIPLSVSHALRRRAYRVDLTQVGDAELQWLSPSHPRAVALTIANISSSGLAVHAPIDLAEGLKLLGEGVVFVSVLDTMFEVAVAVRHMWLVSETHAVIGMEFIALTTGKTQKLEQWVARLQRQVLLQTHKTLMH